MSVPNGFAKLRAEINRSGFFYAFNYDVCNSCLPPEYFSDPPSRKAPPKEFKNGFFSWIREKKNLSLIKRNMNDFRG
jgi:hypothetical protein